MKKVFKVVVNLALIVILLTPSHIVLAQEVTPPSAPTAPSAPTQTQDLPQAPSPPPQPTLVPSNTNNTPTPTPTEAKTQTPSPIPQSTPSVTPSPEKVGNSSNVTGSTTNSATTLIIGNTNSTASNSPNTSTTNSTPNSTTDQKSTSDITQENTAAVNSQTDLGTDTGHNSDSYNVGSSAVSTGDANTSTTAISALNTNTSTVSVDEKNITGTQIGDINLLLLPCQTNCTSTSSASQNSTQDNNLAQNSVVNLLANTGSNNTNYNTGGDSLIQTGNANVSANIVTFANNNIAGPVVVGVINIFGNLIGDIILPSSSATSCSSCSNAPIIVGEGGDNTASNAIVLNQDNQAQINNNLNLKATTGGNITSNETGGDTAVQTGDTKVEASTVNIVNNNVDSGTWWLVIVNNAGQWIGKIIGSPDGSTIASSDTSPVTFNNLGEAVVGPTQSSSTQTTTNSSSTTQANLAVINNTLNVLANTGNNSASYNTGGNSLIKTGNSTILANMLNFVNNNISGSGHMMIAIVNIFGSWKGDVIPPGFTKPAEETSTPAIGGTQDPPANNQNPTVLASDQNSNDNQKTPETITHVLGYPSHPNLYSVQDQPYITPAQTYVAGYKQQLLDITSYQAQNDSALSPQTNRIKINLAWLAIVLPLLVAFMITRTGQLQKLILKKRSR